MMSNDERKTILNNLLLFTDLTSIEEYIPDLTQTQKLTLLSILEQDDPALSDELPPIDDLPLMEDDPRGIGIDTLRYTQILDLVCIIKQSLDISSPSVSGNLVDELLRDMRDLQSIRSLENVEK
jgi:hypothetical protein